MLASFSERVEQYKDWYKKIQEEKAKEVRE